MGKFKIKHTKNDKFSFNLVAGNGEVIGTSEVYESIANAKAGIESVRKNCGVHVEDQTVEGYEVLKHPKYEVYTDKSGQTRFRLKASNGEIILASEAYKQKASCMHGIESVGKNAPDAEIIMEEE